MSSFEHLQPKSISTPVARTSSFLRSSRQFAPMSTPASKQSLPSLVTPEKEEEYQKIIREGDPEIQAAEKYLKDALSKRVPLEEIAQRVAELTKKTFEKLYAHNLTVLKSIEMGVSSSSLARYLEMMDPAFETNNRLLAEIRAREAKEWHPQSPSYKPASYIA